jgi:hypothetical protein
MPRVLPRVVTLSSSRSGLRSRAITVILLILVWISTLSLTHHLTNASESTFSLLDLAQTTKPPLDLTQLLLLVAPFSLSLFLQVSV